MTRPKRAERFRALCDGSGVDMAVRAYASVMVAGLREAIVCEDVLRGARKCRDNAARYRRERDEARRDCVAIRARMGIDLDRALRRAERAESYIATEDMGR